MNRRIRVAAATVGLGVAVALGLAACGPAADSSDAAVDVVAAMGVEGQALAALGVDPADIAPADLAPGLAPNVAPSPSAGAERGEHRDKLRHRLRARVMLRRNMLHGEAVVQTKEGTRTVVVQRGAVTAIDGDSVTVKSSDGFELTWTFGDPMHVVEHRTTVAAQSIQVGTQVAVAGARDGDTVVARLIVVPLKR